MSNEVKDAGFKAGTEGKSASDNPHQSGPAGRMIDIMTFKVDESDRNAADWEDARQAGEESQKNND